MINVMKQKNKSKLEKFTLKFEYNHTWLEAKQDVKKRITE